MPDRLTRAPQPNMQRLRISHLTQYRFAGPVTLLPHRLLLRPREGHDVHIETSRLDIAPSHTVKWHRDLFDNSVAVVSFLEPAAALSIASEVVIQHYEEAPLDFLVEDYAVNYPFVYRPEERADLIPFQQPAYPNDQKAIQDWLRELGAGPGPTETYAMLDRINRTIGGTFTYVVREDEGVQPPSQTLRERRGSCRDYAALFIEACRDLGLASRFVSGYSHGLASETGNAATHAWAEVYLPGPGWKGFDPTAGQIAGAHHIPVAVARHPEAIPPVAGSFVGPAGSRPALIVNVQVAAL